MADYGRELRFGHFLTPTAEDPAALPACGELAAAPARDARAVPAAAPARRCALAEAIEVLRLMWSEERAVSHDGEFYSLAGVRPGPVPAHPIGIWIGGYKPRMLRLVGATADGWLPSLGYIDDAGIADASARIDDAAGESGRDPSAIRRVLNLNGKAEPEELVRLCTGLALKRGIDTFILDAADDQELRRLAAEVIPEIRRQVAQSRGPRPPSDGAAHGALRSWED